MNNHMFHIRLFIFMLLVGFTITAGCVQAQQVSYSGSMQYATGSYFFDESTGSFSMANGLGIYGDKLTVSFSVPYIVQNSPWISYGAAGYIPTGGPQHGSLTDSTGHRPGKGDGKGSNGMGRNKIISSRSGAQTESALPLPDTTSYTESSFGDPNIYANLKLYSSFSGATNIQLNSGLKVPFADPNNGFGTGEWDFGLGFSGSQRLGNYFLYIDVMKWWFGDMPDLELKDPLAYSIGLSRSLGQGKWFVNSTFSGYTEIIQDYDPPLNLGFGLGFFASERVSLNGTLSLGLSESSADQSFGLGWSIKL